MRSRSPHAVTSRRHMALALALAWVTGWFTGLVHLAEETHVYCGAHQQFEERHDEGADADPHDHGAELRSLDQGPSDSHAGCEVLEARPVLDGDATPTGHVLTHAARTVRPEHVPPSFLAIPLLHLAPKASPPDTV